MAESTAQPKISYEPSSGARFTDEATAEYAIAVTKYADLLESMSISRCNSEVVLIDHVKSATDDLGPSKPAQAQTLATILDWVKRFAFLFLGFSVVQVSVVLRQQDIARGSVIWLVFDVVVAAVLVGAAVALDIPWVKRKLLRPA